MFVQSCRSIAAALAVTMISACGGSAPPLARFGPASSFPASVADDGLSKKIAHVVVIVQENRTFDNMFHGFPGANTVGTGSGLGRKYRLQPMSLAYPDDIDHSHFQFLEDFDHGKMDGFDHEIDKLDLTCKDPLNEPRCWRYASAPNAQQAYSFVPGFEVKPLWEMASRYALGDDTFASNNGPSYPSHQYLIAGQAGHVSENPGDGPWGCDAPAGVITTKLYYGQASPPAFSAPTGVEVSNGPFPCFRYITIADRLDAAHISWRYYAPQAGENGGFVWSAFDAIWQVRFGADWYRNVSSPETRIFDDIDRGSLPRVSWVVPSLVNSDHAGSQSTTGPDWVASVVNAIGTSKYWKDTAVIVVWDDWGGWYDHVAPPQYADPTTGVYEGLGFRVPLIVVSPYAKRGYISHRRHEIASSLHFIEKTFGLRSLGTADARADAFDDMFDFAQRPTPFRIIKTRFGKADFLRQKPSLQPPDE